MKHLKLFENNSNPQLGDYVICISRAKIERGYQTPLGDWLDNNIGKITGWYSANTTGKLFSNKRAIVQFDNIPQKFRHVSEPIIRRVGDDNSRAFPLELIKHHSTNKEDLEIFIQSNKYNL